MSAELEPDIGVGSPESVDNGDQSRFCGSTPSSLGLHADELPVPGPDGYDLSASVLYLNRELTWLNFNWRVLHQAEDGRLPLLERLRFVAIVGSNLDEFLMKRIGGLKQQVGARLRDLTEDGRTPERQIQECMDVVDALLDTWLHGVSA